MSEKEEVNVNSGAAGRDDDEKEKREWLARMAARVGEDAEASDESMAVDDEDRSIDSEWAEVAEMGLGVLVAVFPEVKGVCGEDRAAALGAALGRCDRRYGWGGAGGALSHPVTALAAAGGPVLIAVAMAVKARKISPVKSVDVESAPEKVQQGAVQAGTVTFGEVKASE